MALNRYQPGCCCTVPPPPPPNCNTLISGFFVRCGAADYSGITVTMTSVAVAPATTTYADQSTTTDSTGYFALVNPVTVDNYTEYADCTITGSYAGYDSLSRTIRTGCSGPMSSFGDNFYTALSPDATHCCNCNCLWKRTYHLTCAKGSVDLVYSDANRAWLGTLNWTEPEGGVMTVYTPGTQNCQCVVKQTVTAHAQFVLGCDNGNWTLAMYSAFSTIPNQKVYPDCWDAFGTLCRNNDPNWRNEPRFLDQAGGYGTSNVADPYGGLAVACDGSSLSLTFSFAPSGWPPETPTTVTVTE